MITPELPKPDLVKSVPLLEGDSLSERKTWLTTVIGNSPTLGWSLVMLGAVGGLTYQVLREGIVSLRGASIYHSPR